jgi:hypothetical protein
MGIPQIYCGCDNIVQVDVRWAHNVILICFTAWHIFKPFWIAPVQKKQS